MGNFNRQWTVYSGESPYTKAQFVTRWYEAGRSEGIDLTDIALSIGDRHNTIQRMVSAIYLLEQAEREGVFDVEDRYTRRLNFSHLYAALSRHQFAQFLGLESDWALHDPEPDQVPTERLGELRKMLIWIYGSKKDGVRPVVQLLNPDIKRLGEVLSHAEGRHVLETTRDLSAAHASTEPKEWQFTTSLIRARDNMRKAVGALGAYDGRDQSLLDISEDVNETAEVVRLRMLTKRHEVRNAE